ncbi:MAG: amidohydrolase family protein [Bacteroidota bacterium]
MKTMKTCLILITILTMGCSRAPEFKTFQKIDAHVHLETGDDSFVKIVEENSFQLLTLVTRAAPQLVINEEFNYARTLALKHPETIAFATTFTMDGFGEPDWEEKTLNWLEKSFREGAIAVKVWKDIGMTFRDQDGNFILVDDPRFDPVFDFVESRGKTLVNHNGEPRNCWLPLSEMTVMGDINYFTNHPEYHMYLHPEYPSYETLNAARDRMLEKHPNLRYVGCHLGSLEWDVDELAKELDRFPNMSVDMAERICHFKIQDRDKVRDFFIRYQDRLLYGTDIAFIDKDLNVTGMEKAQDILDNIWLSDWEYFTTDHMLIQEDKVKEYQGLKLPASVLKKIYYENAVRMYPELGTKH